jgi:WD40 repeat protein
LADGKTLISAGKDCVIDSWDVTSGKLVNQIQLEKVDRTGQGSSISGRTFSADGSTVLFYWNNMVRIYEAGTGKERCTLSTGKSQVYRASLSFDGTLAAAQLSEAKASPIYLWDARTGKELHILSSRRNVSQLTFSPDGRLLGAVGREGLRLWDTKAGTERLSIQIQADSLMFAPDGRLLVTGNAGLVTLWDAVTGQKKVMLASSVLSHISVLAISPDGKTLAAGGQNGLTLWNMETRKEIAHVAHSVFWLAFTPDGKTLASSAYSSIRLWDIGSGKQVFSREGHLGKVDALAVSPDGKRIASISVDRETLRLWDAATGRPGPVFQKLNRNVRHCAFSSDGKWAICAMADGTVRFWEADTGREEGKYLFHDPKRKSEYIDILDFHLSKDRKRLVAIGWFDAITPWQLHVWDVLTGKTIGSRQIEGANQYAISPDGNSIGLLNRERLAIQDVVTGKELVSISGAYGDDFNFSPDSQMLAVITSTPSNEALGHEAHGITLLQVTDGKPVFHINTGPIGRFVFSLDGRMLATAHADSLRLWEVATGKELFRIRRPEGFHDIEWNAFVKCLSFMPSGKALATGLGDSTVLVWDLTPPVRSKKILDREALMSLWEDLSGEPPAAYRAVWMLAESPDSVVPFLKDRLRPAAETDPKLVQKLLADLDSDVFAVRKTAVEELTKLGERVAPALHQAMERRPSLEVRRQVKMLLDAQRSIPSPASLRTLRAIQVLERIDSAEARHILQAIATGALVRETREAQEALARMAAKIR